MAVKCGLVQDQVFIVQNLAITSLSKKSFNLKIRITSILSSKSYHRINLNNERFVKSSYESSHDWFRKTFS